MTDNLREKQLLRNMKILTTKGAVSQQVGLLSK
jgi:hypothetical protein